VCAECSKEAGSNNTWIKRFRLRPRMEYWLHQIHTVWL
jgi:hypothetical protein